MPAHKKTVSKVAQSASKKNTEVVAHLGADAIFARVNANLGSYFRLTCFDGVKQVEILGSPRGLFKQRKAQIRFERDDIVVLSSMPSRGSEISEIIALLSKKDAQQLFKDNLIHKSIYNAPPAFGEADGEAVSDDIFDRSGEVEGEGDMDIDAI
jgi:hypothetical protein